MWWFVSRLEKSIKDRKRYATCSRCGGWYKKQLKECPHCAELSDADLKKINSKSAKTTMAIGRYMAILSVVILLFLIVMAY